MSKQRYVREVAEAKQRILVISFFVGLLFFFLMLRLWHLQILNAENYSEMSENNRLRFVPIAASRGAILDRNNEVLVKNQPSFSLAVVPQEVVDKDALIANLANLLKLDSDDMRKRWDKAKGKAKYYPVVIASDISRDQLEIVEENRLRLPGVEIEMKPVREYAFGSFAAHLLGYIGEISESELERNGYEDYNLGDYIGKNGIEKSWEKVLHGSDGGKQLEVDAKGRVLRTISEAYPTVGNSVVLTIDAELQKQAERSFGEQAGAAVAMDVNTGEVLAFVSSPSFEPALFSGRMPKDVWQSYLDDKRHPLENKALSGQYPPGSTFKIITALAGLENGTVNNDSTISCNGKYELGSSTFKCWNKHGHGTVNLKKSLRESCDVYYYQLGEKLGVDKIAAVANQFKIGEALGIGLVNEKTGLMPTSEWKQKRFGKRWYHGESLPVAIGQGYVLMTPIQLASMISTVANEGTVFRPYLVKKIVDADGKPLQEFKPEVINRTKISPQSYRLVKQGLFSVVNEPGGTGSMARLYDVKVAGKTGTSQVVKMRDSRVGTPYQFRDHALFVAFAPFEKPEIAVAVVVEHGEHGGSAAGPIAGRILRAYFDRKKPKPQQTQQKNVTDDREEDDDIMKNIEKENEVSEGSEKND